MMGFRFSLAPLLAVTAFAGSAGVIWLAHIEAGEMTRDRKPPLVKAASLPLKRAPDDPGGRDVADLGGVGDLLRDEPAEAEERLLPRSEQPVTPAEQDSTAGPGSLTVGSNDARAALEALVSEVRAGRPTAGDAGAGGPNAEEPISFPSPSRPAAATDTSEPVTPRRVASTNSDRSPAANDQPAATNVAALSPTDQAAPTGRYRVQLAAVRTDEDAERAWDLFQQQLGPSITGLKPFFERAETSNGIFFRVQVGPFSETTEANSLCVELKKQDVSCFVVSR